MRDEDELTRRLNHPIYPDRLFFPSTRMSSASVIKSSSSTSSTTTTSSSSSSTSLLRWLGGAVGAGLTLAVAVGLLRYKLRTRGLKNTNDDQPPPLEPIPSHTSSESPQSPITVKPHTWNEEEFKARATHFLQLLGEENRVDRQDEAELRAALDGQVMKFSIQARALGAHFLLATNAFYLTSSVSEDQFESRMTKQKEDMELAWKLLECVNGSEDDERALDIMRIQVAQCLKDASTMIPIFDRMTGRASAPNFQDEELILLFTTAPLLGRWSKTVELGQELESKHDLNEFHQAPMDYQILYELAKTEQQRGDVPQSQLQWQTYNIICQQIRLRESECDDPNLIDALNTEFTVDGRKIWKTITQKDARFVRCGALCQLRSFSPALLALVGPASDTRIIAEGYINLDGSKQTERHELTRVQANELEGDHEALTAALATLSTSSSSSSSTPLHWKGSYKMVQEPDDGPNRIPAKLTMILDLEMTLVKL